MLPALPILIPLLTACLCLLLGHRRRVQRRVAVAGATALLIAGIVLLVRTSLDGRMVLYLGGWQAPLGITLVSDMFASIMVVAAAVLHLSVTIYSIADIDNRRHRFGYFGYLNAMMMGVCGAFMTGDLFNLYVWFEVMLMASFVLLVLGGDRAQIEAGIKYVTLSLLSSALFLAAIGLIYGIAHTLNMAHLSERLALARESRPWLLTAVSVLLFLSFGIKAAVFPLHFWLPASYHTPPAAITAIFAGMLTKVGLYSMVRVFSLVMPTSDYLLTLLGGIACLTMVVGVLGALSQSHIRRILSVHIISQVGYMVMGVALLGATDPLTRRLAIAATIFYIVHNMLAKTNLLLVSGTVHALKGSEHLSRLGGLLKEVPWLAIIFLCSAFSLAGLPPSPGFWAKLSVIQAAFMANSYLLAGTALVVSLLTLLSMVKIWSEAFWKPQPDLPEEEAQSALQLARRARLRMPYRIVPMVILLAITLAIGIYPQSFMAAAGRAADQLLERESYVEDVDLLPLEPDATEDSP